MLEKTSVVRQGETRFARGKKNGVSTVNSLFLLITTAVPSVSVGLHNLFRNNSVMCVLLKTTVVYRFSPVRGKLS